MKAEEAQCTSCILFSGCQRQLLNGSGPTDARIMLVGEAPGYHEDVTGVPFVGDAGAKLSELLVRAGMRREDLFVTNSVRCRPPDNRKPTVKEINACKPHLVREIEAVKPDLIFAMGNFALRSVTGLSGISKYRLTTQSVHRTSGTHQCLVIPTWHPAYALRYPEHEDEIVQDLITGMRHLQGGFAEIQTPYRFFREGHIPTGSPGMPWSFDIETNAREVHDPDLQVWFAAVDDGDYITMFVGDAELQVCADLLHQHLAAGGILVGHNASAFDRSIMHKKYGRNIKCGDTQLLAHLLDENQSLKLQNLAIRYLGVAPWKDKFDVAFWQRGPQTREEWADALQYTARDARYTRLLFMELWERATQAERVLYESHNLACSRGLRATELAGVYLSSANVNTAIAQIETDQQAAMLNLKSIAGEDFNPGSHNQVRDLLFSDLLLPVQKKTKGREASTDEETLKRLIAMGLEPYTLGNVVAYRKNAKLMGYLKKYREICNEGGWWFPWTSMSHTATGRTNGDGQQVPRDPRVRGCITAPPGYVLIEVDFSQIEMRLAGEFAGPSSPLFLEYLKPSPDVHMTMAEFITKKPRAYITDEERARAKPANFGSLYQLFAFARHLGIESWKTYQRTVLTDYDQVVTKEECLAVQEAFSHWGLDPWYERRINDLYCHGQITTLYGRTRRLPAIRSHDEYAQLEAARQGVNFDDQSSGGDLGLLGLTGIVGYGIEAFLYVHDSVLARVPEDEAMIRWAAQTMRYAFEVDAPRLTAELFGYQYQVPIKADLKIGRFWGDKSLNHLLDSVVTPLYTPTNSLASELSRVTA